MAVTAVGSEVAKKDVASLCANHLCKALPSANPLVQTTVRGVKVKENNID
jgi:hypothetical protein